jgi:hypothetical protein
MDESQRETPALLIRRKCCGNWRLAATLCQAASVKKNYIGWSAVSGMESHIEHTGSQTRKTSSFGPYYQPCASCHARLTGKEPAFRLCF